MVSAATSLLDRPMGAEQLACVPASPVALSVLPGDTAAEGTGFIDMADTDGATAREAPDPAPHETDAELMARFERDAIPCWTSCTAVPCA
ncbi:hypothetical protein MSEO_51690 [Mycobacterium seoulense]|uniref:Uncharacterized protein n=1 Tax=Mycobacterium seoulense TaxID=386911 RepID=A0A7I7P7X5_9MYCO|nr:hypothetical protein MSEO_51690 [Mycobacterium seoulense]